MLKKLFFILFIFILTFGSGSISGGFNTGKSNHDSAWVNDQTELTANNVDINVDGKTTITGATIAAVDENGLDNGNLNLATNELEYKDIKDFNTSSESGFGFSSNVGISTDKGKTNLHPSGSTTISMKDKGNESEQTTHATIGGGSITVGGRKLDDNDPALAGLNRDTDKSQEITRDEITGALDGSVTIDNRLLTSKGRAQIADQHENLGKNAIKTLKDASVAPVAMGGIVYGLAGTLLNSNGEVIAGKNGNLHFVGNVLGPGGGAINLGGAISYYGQSNPDDVKSGGVLYGATDKLILGYHEESHTDQWREMSSPVFLYEWVKNGGPTSSNPFENNSSGGANDRAKNRMINEGIFDKVQSIDIPGWEKDKLNNYNYIPGNAGIYK